MKADLGIRCLHMPKDTFKHGATHIIFRASEVLCDVFEVHCNILQTDF